MRHTRYYALVIAFLACWLPQTQASDQQKADKQLRKITAMCADATARSIVSRTMSDMLDVKRAYLVRQRRNLGVNYGSLFLVNQLTAAGVGIADIVAGLRAGQDLYQIADEKHADWKLVAANAKKLKSKIEDNIYKHYLNKKNTELDEARDTADHYNPDADWIRADRDVTAPEVTEAAASFEFWRKHAGENNVYRGLTTAEEKAAAFDHTGADHTKAGETAPAAGGTPPK